MSILTKIKTKLKSGTWYPFYNTFYEKEKIDPKMVLLESRSGRGLESNIFVILQELNKKEYEQEKNLLDSVLNIIKEKGICNGTKR